MNYNVLIEKIERINVLAKRLKETEQTYRYLLERNDKLKLYVKEFEDTHMFHLDFDGDNAPNKSDGYINAAIYENRHKIMKTAFSMLAKDIDKYGLMSNNIKDELKTLIKE